MSQELRAYSRKYLTNVVKHSQSSAWTFEIAMEPEILELIIIDVQIFAL